MLTVFAKDSDCPSQECTTLWWIIQMQELRNDGRRPSQRAINSGTFLVYTEDEIDEQQSKQANEKAKEIGALNEKIAALNDNLKIISDANYALTKRLQGVERRYLDLALNKGADDAANRKPSAL
jgi:hypothetical protein